jgi:hypothetical protein
MDHSQDLLRVQREEHVSSQQAEGRFRDLQNPIRSDAAQERDLKTPRERHPLK